MIVRTKRTLRLFLVGCALSAGLAGELRAAEVVLLQPYEVAPIEKGRDSAGQRRPDDPAHYNRRGRVKMLLNDLTSIQAINPGDRLRINVFSDKPYWIVVDSRGRDRFGGQNITGHIEGTQDQTFVMAINDSDFVISLQDLDTGNTFYLSGKSGTGLGEAVEVDDRKRPRRIK